MILIFVLLCCKTYFVYFSLQHKGLLLCLLFCQSQCTDTLYDILNTICCVITFVVIFADDNKNILYKISSPKLTFEKLYIIIYIIISRDWLPIFVINIYDAIDILYMFLWTANSLKLKQFCEGFNED